MAFAYQVPGVYREEEFRKPEALLPTGVAGFVGVAKSKVDESTGKSLASTAKPTVLHHQEDFDLYFEAQPGTYLADAVKGFFRNGGVRCYVAYSETARVDLFQQAVEALAPKTDLDLIAVPDAVKLPGAEMLRFQQWLLSHCAGQGDRFAILDMPADPVSVSDHQKNLVATISAARTFGAIYYPWLRVDKEISVPPCGHVAGIYARSDARMGFFKAPANEEMLGVFDLSAKVSFTDQELLNPLGVNCIRALPGRGIRLMGARTLSNETAWRYVNVRRLFITLRRWIDLHMAWAAFEPNTPALWMQIKRELDNYLHGLWLRGAIKGGTAEEAFYVKCDSETSPPDSRDGGVITEIGLAPAVPAEFVVVHIVHRQPVVAEAGGNV